MDERLRIFPQSLFNNQQSEIFGVMHFPITDPTLIFFVVMIIILFAPIIMGKLRIPHIVGMVLAGVIIGTHGLNILVRDNSFELFGRVGLYYIMFLASLEMDMEGLKKNISRIATFGTLTFAVPFILAMATSALLLRYSVTAALLTGCIMSSNTLVAYPIVSRYGLQRKPSVMLSVGATMVALLFALIALAALVSSHEKGSGALFWLFFILKFTAYCAAAAFFVPRLSRWFLRRYSDSVMQFVFIMAILFLCASLSELIGLEGIFGAFVAGLILNRYVPRLSPLMNRIEFIGNALFIPYFLIGVGMLINVRLLFQGSSIIIVMLVITVFGTLGKAIASYGSSRLFGLPRSSGQMMFGLTSAHAAGAIAMLMVGMKLPGPDGGSLITNDMLNAVVLMILITCIISSIVTERSAWAITLRDKEMPHENDRGVDDERILVPVKYPEYANNLIDLAMMMRNVKLNRSLFVLNVVYDDTNMERNQEAGLRLLEQVTNYAAADDVRVQTQVRVAANIANGIKHAFKEFRNSEIIIGMHSHKNVSPKFWGEFHQSLFNGLNRQIMMVRIMQPLNTLRRIVVVVPSRAQFEPGFYRWLERLSRLAGNLECLIEFHGRDDTIELITKFLHNLHPEVRFRCEDMPHWNGLPKLASTIADDHLFVVVTARKGTVSFKNAQERLPEELTKYFSGKNMMIVFPDQHGESMDELTFAQPQHTEERSAYDDAIDWIKSKVKR
jgi:Kef-type K+ transport system membrane component KefB